MNVTIALARSLGERCRPINSDQRLYVAATDAFLFADGGVVCGPFQSPAHDPHSVTNPVVLVEVLSPSTGETDQGAKFDHYRRLPSLQHYLLVDPDQPHVIHHRRVGDGWLRHDHIDGAVRLDADLALEDVYARLDDV